MSLFAEPVGRRLLAYCFTKAELGFLSRDDRFVNAFAGVVTLEHGIVVARIGEQLLREAWLAAATKGRPGSR